MFHSAIQEIFVKGWDEKFLKHAERFIMNKQESIKELRLKIQQKAKEFAFITMDLYRLWEIYQQIAYRDKCQKAIKSKIQKLFQAHLKLGHALESLPWYNIADCKKSRSEQSQKTEQMSRKVQIVYKHMESRDIATKLRQAQQKNLKLANWVKKAKLVMSKRSKREQLVIDAALQKRNDVILNMVFGSKLLQNLRLKLRQKGNKKKRIKELRTKCLKPIFLNVEKKTEKIFDKSIENFKIPKVPSKTVLKPAKPSFNIRFSTLNFGTTNAKVNNKLLEKNSSINLDPMVRNSIKNQNEEGLNQANKQKRMEIKIPDQVVSRCDTLKKSGNDENKTKTTGGVRNISSQKMEVDLIKEVNLTKKSEADKSELTRMKQLTLSSKGKEKSIKSDEKPVVLENTNNSNNASRASEELHELFNKSMDIFKKPKIPTKIVSKPLKSLFNHHLNTSNIEKMKTKVNNKSLLKGILHNVIKNQSEQRFNEPKRVKIKMPGQNISSCNKVKKSTNEEKETKTNGGVRNISSQKMEVDLIFKMPENIKETNLAQKNEADKSETTQVKQITLSSIENEKYTKSDEKSVVSENSTNREKTSSSEMENKLSEELKEFFGKSMDIFKEPKVSTKIISKPSKSVSICDKVMKNTNEEKETKTNDLIFKMPENIKEANSTKKSEADKSEIQLKQLTLSSKENEKSNKSEKMPVVFEDSNNSENASSSEIQSRVPDELDQNNKNLEKSSNFSTPTSINKANILQFSDVDQQSNFGGTISNESERGENSTYFL